MRFYRSLALAACGVTLIACGLSSTPTSNSGGQGGQVETPAPTTPLAAGTIADGTWSVPDEVKPGTYVSTVPDDGIGFCHWSRLKGFSGDAQDLLDIGSGSTGDRMRVTIKSSDKGFETKGCGIWRKI